MSHSFNFWKIDNSRVRQSGMQQNTVINLHYICMAFMFAQSICHSKRLNTGHSEKAMFNIPHFRASSLLQVKEGLSRRLQRQKGIYNPLHLCKPASQWVSLALHQQKLACAVAIKSIPFCSLPAPITPLHLVLHPPFSCYSLTCSGMWLGNLVVY